MERIGIAASKMAKGNLLWYNAYVVLLSFLFALLIFLIGASAVVIALIVLGYIVQGGGPGLAGQGRFGEEWQSIMLVCLGSLSFVVGCSTLVAILRNIKFHK